MTITAGFTCDLAPLERGPQRIFCTSAMISIQRSPASKAYYNGN